MKSRQALFNKGIALSYLKRCWPLWLGYLMVIMLTVPGHILPQLHIAPGLGEEELFWRYLDINRSILYTAQNSLGISAAAGVIAAMVMYSFMYNNRSCSMMCALPVRRETLFVTAFLTGLAPMLVIDVLAVAVTAVPALSGGYADAVNLWRLLGMLGLGNIAFYCFAVFCAVLTGNIVVLPVVYVILNVAAVLAEQTVRSVLDIIVYGFNSTQSKLTAFSPFAAIGTWFNARSETEAVIINGYREMRETGVFTVDHFYVLFIYCAVGLALVFLAGRIYSRRSMECAGDVVAVSVLKPIFKYCMCFGVAFSFTAVVYNNIFYRINGGSGVAAAVLLILLAGAFMGYFASEMLMQKTLRVFKGRWKGFVVSALILTVFVLAAELDVTGYEKRVPDTEDISNVTIAYYDGATLEKAESLEAVTAYHQLLIDSKDENERADRADHIVLDYTLNNGRRVSRSYSIAKDDEQLLNADSCINRLFPVVNLQEAIDKRAATQVPVTERNVQDGWLNGFYVDEEGEYHHFEYELTDAEAAELYNECILPDAHEGKLKRIFPVNNDEYYSCATTVTFNFGVRGDDYRHYYYDFVMYMDAPRSARWIEENTDIELLPLMEADWQNYENDQFYINYYKPVMENSRAAQEVAIAAAATRAAG